MDKHKPVKELPEDIKQLPHEETVCRFCGVSYLIHHEISKLEDKVEQLQQNIKRLKYIESEKASWDNERADLKEKLNRAVEEQSRLQASLKGKEEKLKQSQSQCDVLKSDGERQDMENQAMRSKQAQYLEQLSVYKTEVCQLKHYGAEVQQLLSSTASSLAQWRQQCLVRCLSYSEKNVKVQNQLRAEIDKLQNEMKCQKEEWDCIESNLVKSLKEAQDSCEKRTIEIRDLLEKTNKWEVEIGAKDEKIEDQSKELKLCKYEVRDLGSKVKASSDENKCLLRRAKDLDAELTEIKSSKSSTQSTLEVVRQELKTLEQDSISKQEALRCSLENCQQDLAKLQKVSQAAQLEHSEQLEALKKEHNTQLEVTRQALVREHKMILQRANDRHLSSNREMQSKLTQLKSSLAASELEKDRLVKSLQEELKKEKDIADRELTNHLSTVKTLELSLLQEQRARKELENRTLVNNEETQQARKSLKSAERKRHDLESKLTGAYQEISTLQAIVERECEERERLTEALSQAKTMTKTPHKTSNKKH